MRCVLGIGGQTMRDKEVIKALECCTNDSKLRNEF